MAKLLPSGPPFANRRVYGPCRDRKQDRKMVTRVRDDGYRTTMSYARYLLCVREGKIPDRSIDADHVDDDKTNDNPENIQALERVLNIAKGNKSPTMVILICGGCGKEFIRQRKDTYLVRKKYKTTSCSRKCATAVRCGYGVAVASAGGE